jgi:glycosyltransferase involved in cell wall biosynthesis
MCREYPSDRNIHYHLVGEADRNYLNKINPNVRACFIRHPHYNVTDKKVIKFSLPKIKILVAGQYNLYMKTAFDELLPVLCEHKKLAEHYSITFLGKGWDFAVERLQAAGYESKRLGFVDVYLDEIIKYDIQLTPISVGTGTKGKVLDALANGLLTIGTPYALENIAVENGKSCIIYEKAEEVIKILNYIPKNIPLYEKMAEAGREAVLKYHDRSTVSKELFSLFNV